MGGFNHHIEKLAANNLRSHVDILKTSPDILPTSCCYYVAKEAEARSQVWSFCLGSGCEVTKRTVFDFCFRQLQDAQVFFLFMLDVHLWVFLIGSFASKIQPSPEPKKPVKSPGISRTLWESLPFKGPFDSLSCHGFQMSRGGLIQER